MTEQNLQTIIKAIQEKKSISFEYNKPNKVNGIRTGNPYVIYWKDDETKRYLDLHQESGVSDSVSEDEVHWVTLETVYISNVKLKENTFSPIADYKRYAPKYMIANIKI